MKKGRFNETEFNIINSELNRYQELHTLTGTEMLEIIHARPEKNKTKSGSKNSTFMSICKDLGKHLPGRYSEQIVNYVRSQWHESEMRGQWTVDEDQKLLKAYREFGPSWKKISPVVGRAAKSCQTRWTWVLGAGENRKIGFWSDEEEVALMESMDQVSDREAAQENTLGGYWVQVSENMAGKRTGPQCREKW